MKKIYIYHDKYKLNKKDFLFLSAIIPVILGLFLLLNIHFESSGSFAGLQIGTIVLKKNLIQRRSSESLVWEDTLSATPTFERDFIRSGKSSSALIQLYGGKINIDVDENTLLILDIPDSEESQKIILDRGSFTLRQDPDQKKDTKSSVAVIYKDKKLKLSGGDVAISQTKDGDELELQVTKGETELTNEQGSAQNLKANERVLLDVKSGSIEKEEAKIVTLEPADGVHIFSKNKKAKASFRWEVTKNFSNENYIEISKNKTFPKKSSFYIRKRVKNNSLVVELAKGVYYWRVYTVKKGKKIYSLKKKFTILRQKVFYAYGPSGLYYYSGKETTINFNWSLNEHAKSYEFKIAKDPGFKQLVHKENTIGNYLTLDLQEGKYYWKAAILSPYPNARLTTSSQILDLVYKAPSKVKQSEKKLDAPEKKDTKDVKKAKKDVKKVKAKRSKKKTEEKELVLPPIRRVQIFRLTNGKVIKGVIHKNDEKYFYIRTVRGGVIKIKNDDLESIEG